MKRFPIIVLFLGLVAGCASVRPFEPIDAPQAHAPGGVRAAVYEISSGQGNWDNVVVHVWTLGVSSEKKTAENKNPRSFLDVQWRVTNHSKNEVKLDLAASRLLLPSKKNSRPYTAAAEADSEPAAVSPDAEKTFTASFPLPNGFDPVDLRAFEVTWGLTGNERRYGQTTRFERPQSRVQPSLGIGLGVGF